MDQSSPNPIPSSVLGDADPATAALLATQPEQAQTIALLYEISHELTSILDREELLRRIAERVKKLVNYQVFAVLLWNESTQMLESVFAQRYENALPSRFQMPLHQRITGTVKTRAKIRPGCSTTWKRRAKFSGSFCPAALRKFPASMWPRPTCRPASLAAIFTTCCPTVWVAWPSPTVTFREKARLQRFMGPWPLVSCVSLYTTTRFLLRRCSHSSTVACWLPVLMRDSLRCNSASMTPPCANLPSPMPAARCRCSSTTAKSPRLTLAVCRWGCYPKRNMMK